MGALLACTITRADLLGDALHEESESLTPTMPKRADGCGVGFYQAGEVLHRKRPQSIDGPISWDSVVEGIRSHVAVAHVREATFGDGRADNTQPFRMRQWLFAHIGSLPGQDGVRSRLRESLPDFLRRNVRGETDSELLFHVVLSFLHDSGHLDSVDVTHAAAMGALRSTVTLVDRHGREVGAGPGSLTLALTNGRQLYALRRGLPLAIAERDRLPRRDSGGVDGRSNASYDVRYVVVASCLPNAAPVGYRELADGEVVCVDRDLNVTRNTLE